MPLHVHFLSGLPRSGSTLLGALLRQNPRFVASMSTPVLPLAAAVQRGMASAEFSPLFDDARRAAMLRGVFDAYYAAAGEGQVVFDTNRGWTSKMALSRALYPSSRVICCVREVPWILDSFERMFNRNPLRLSRMFRFEPGSTVYARAEALMGPDKGQVGQPWSGLREAWFGEEAKRLIVVPYETLARDPRGTLERLYRELGEPAFGHDPQDVRYEETEYDENLGMPGLHTVRPKVEFLPREACIPPDLFAKYAGTDFWARPGLNRRGVTVL